MKKWLSFIVNRAAKISVKGTYYALLMYYSYQSKHTPQWAKRVIVGAVTYLILPLDTIPDFLPLIGFTDDIGVLAASVATIALYITDEVKLQAVDKLKSIFTKIDKLQIEELNQPMH